MIKCPSCNQTFTTPNYQTRQPTYKDLAEALSNQSLILEAICPNCQSLL
jgi:C4-type Zn-finger protein